MGNPPTISGWFVKGHFQLLLPVYGIPSHTKLDWLPPYSPSVDTWKPSFLNKISNAEYPGRFLSHKCNRKMGTYGLRLTVKLHLNSTSDSTWTWLAGFFPKDLDSTCYPPFFLLSCCCQVPILWGERDTPPKGRNNFKQTLVWRCRRGEAGKWQEVAIRSEFSRGWSIKRWGKMRQSQHLLPIGWLWALESVGWARGGIKEEECLQLCAECLYKYTVFYGMICTLAFCSTQPFFYKFILNLSRHRRVPGRGFLHA